MCLSCRCSGQLPDAARLPLSAFLYLTNIRNNLLKVKYFTMFFVIIFGYFIYLIPLMKEELLHFTTKKTIFVLLKNNQYDQLRIKG